MRQVDPVPAAGACASTHGSPTNPAAPAGHGGAVLVLDPENTELDARCRGAADHGGQGAARRRGDPSGARARRRGVRPLRRIVARLPRVRSRRRHDGAPHVARVRHWGCSNPISPCCSRPAELVEVRLGSDRDRFESESHAFHERVRDGYRALARGDPAALGRGRRCRDHRRGLGAGVRRGAGAAPAP